MVSPGPFLRSCRFRGFKDSESLDPGQAAPWPSWWLASCFRLVIINLIGFLVWMFMGWLFIVSDAGSASTGLRAAMITPAPFPVNQAQELHLLVQQYPHQPPAQVLD